MIVQPRLPLSCSAVAFEQSDPQGRPSLLVEAFTHFLIQ